MLAGVYYSSVKIDDVDTKGYPPYLWVREISLNGWTWAVNAIHYPTMKLLPVNSYRFNHPTPEAVKEMGIPVNIQGWNSDHPIFRKLIEEVKPSIIVEVGTWRGRSAINMAKICRNLSISTTIYCIDTWLGGIDHILSNKELDSIPHYMGYPALYYQFLTNVVSEGVDDMIVPVPMPSVQGLRVLKHLWIKPDLVYVDGSHEMGDVFMDVDHAAMLEPKVIFGDDWGMPGVKGGVETANMEMKGWVYPEIIDGNFWVMRRLQK